MRPVTHIDKDIFMNPNILPITSYDNQLNDKVKRLTSMMTPFAAPEPDVYPSPPEHYRMRAEFRIWHDGDDLYHIMFDPQTKQRIKIEQFPAGSLLINQLMVETLNQIRDVAELRHKLFQIDYLSTLSERAIISLIYHKKLGEQWEITAAKLYDSLCEKGFNVQIIGRAAKQKICFHHDYVDECLLVAGRKLIYRQVENSFTQPNAAVNIKMLEWALDITQNSEGDLLELYCGNGNFSLALAQNFRRVLATEIAKPSVAAAQFNISANRIDNVDIIRMSAEEFTQAMKGTREFRRLQGIDLKSYRCDTIFVDPPRAGLDDETVKMIQDYKRIVYISCNPETLCGNLETLTKTHSVKRLALFDQFPYTHHMECGVLLEKIG